MVEVVRLLTRGRKGGVGVQQRMACVYYVSDGLISKQVIYLDRAEALAAAGLTRSDAQAATDLQ